MAESSILIAGIGNIFHRDDAFGVEVIAKLRSAELPQNVRAIDFGIRGFDLVLALLEQPDVTIFVDALSRGGAPGTLYMIEPDPASIQDASETAMFDNAHGLHPVKVLAMAQGLGASLGQIVVIGCEPEVLDDETGCIGLTGPVQAAVGPALDMIHGIVSRVNERRTQVSVQHGKECVK